MVNKLGRVLSETRRLLPQLDQLSTHRGDKVPFISLNPDIMPSRNPKRMRGATGAAPAPGPRPSGERDTSCNQTQQNLPFLYFSARNILSAPSCRSTAKTNSLPDLPSFIHAGVTFPALPPNPSFCDLLFGSATGSVVAVGSKGGGRGKEEMAERRAGMRGGGVASAE